MNTPRTATATFRAETMELPGMGENPTRLVLCENAEFALKSADYSPYASPVVEFNAAAGFFGITDRRPTTTRHSRLAGSGHSLSGQTAKDKCARLATESNLQVFI